MPLTRKKADEDTILTPVQSFIGQLPDGDDFRAVAGVTRIRATHPAAKAWPHLFAPFDLPTAELGALRVALERPYVPRADPTAPRVLGPIPPERRMVAKRDIWAGKAIAIWAGTVIDQRDPLVKRFPDAFEKAPKEAA